MIGSAFDSRSKFKRERPSLPNILTGLAGLVGFSTIAAILVVTMLVPALAVTSSVAKSSIGVFEDLPDYITLGTLAQANAIYANRNGKPVQIATVYNQNRQELAWNQVSQYLKDAAIAGEDKRFYAHGGVDVPSVARAAIGNFTHKEIQSGSSTLDMQLVKNILVQQALEIDNPFARKKAYLSAITDTFSRKLKEMKLAIALDKKYTKNEVLLGYLNITGFGGNTYGVQAAAQEYFSVDASKVTIAQAASLLAIVQQPNYQNLSTPKNYAANKFRRDQILRDMYDQGFITKAEFDKAIATAIKDEIKPSPEKNGCLYAADAKFACDYVQRLVPTLTALGATPEERTAAWQQGGFKVYTSIDLNQQDVAQNALYQNAPNNETRFALGSSAVSMQPGSGRILVMAQNKEYDNSGTGGGPTTTAINFNTDKDVGGSSGFQTGSTYKIFTLTDWLENGHALNDVINGSSRLFQQSSFRAKCTSGFGGKWTPKNDSAGEGGNMTVMTATHNSVNAAFVTMAQQLDLCDIRDVAMSMGVHRADGNPLVVTPSSVLGINEIAPLTMAGAISTIGAGGVYCAPTIVDSIVRPDGTKEVGQAKTCSQALPPNIASTVAYALAGVLAGGTGTAGNPRDGIPIVGKTGTTDNADQNWLIATTTTTALAVWVGNTQGHQSLRRISVAGTNGYNTKFNIFRTIMKSLDSEFGGGAFPGPDPKLLAGKGIKVPNLTGESFELASSVLMGLKLTPADGGTVPSALPAGEVVSTSPGAGGSVGIGGTVTLYRSDGSLTATMPNEIGSTRAAAVSDLQSNGYNSANINTVWVAGAADCAVVSTTPAPGAATSLSAHITLRVNDGGAVDGVDPGTCP